MLCFPQLLTGAVGQFPGSKRVIRRTVVNEAGDGSRVKLGDTGAGEVQWTLELKGLTDSEWEAIEMLFEAVEGRLGTFTFLDPFGNLLQWSQDLSAAAWHKSAGVTVAGGHDDPLGGVGASLVTNGGTGGGRISQSVQAPGRYGYCLSLYARCGAPSSLTLFARTQSAEAEREFRIGPMWRRLEHSVSVPSTDEVVEFGARLAPGGTAEVFGFQVEAQAGASKYKRTTARSGAHAGASFADDELVRTANGIDDNACTLRIRASE